MIPQDFIRQLQLSCNIEDIISPYVNLKNEGRNRKGLCPFHSEKTPSMVVYNDTQSFYCFGCGAGGDAITFIMKIENLEYIEAVRLLAQRLGMEVPETESEDKTGKLRSRILEINREAAHFYHNCLKSPIGAVGYAYFKSRELQDKTIKKYGLGYAPNSWDSLLMHLRTKGFTDEEMDAARVVSRGKNGGYFDFFRNRAMFPVIDLRGNVIAFGGRVLDDSKPKYLNTADTLVFKKSKNLFSMNFAKSAIKDKVILAEGYMDVIAINAAGFENVVATLGTALTSEQARLIENYAKEVIIAYDSDGAGQTATHRAINLLSDVNVSTKAIKMEGAKDPDEFIKKFGAKRFELLLDGASNVVEFELEKLRKSFDLTAVDGKIEYVKRAVSVLCTIKSPIEREVYAGIISRETGVAVQSIMMQANSAYKRRVNANEKKEWMNITSNRQEANNRINPERAKVLRLAKAEDGIISYLLGAPEYTKYITEKITADDFVTNFNRSVFVAILNVVKTGVDATLMNIAEEFSVEQRGEIAKELATGNMEKHTENRLNDYIELLKNHKNSLVAKDVRNMAPDEIELIRQRLNK